MTTVFSVINLRPIRAMAIIASIAWMTYFIANHIWIDSALLFTRASCVFLVLASIRRFPVWGLLPASIALSQPLDWILEAASPALMDAVRLVVPNAVNPQYILIGLVFTIGLYLLVRVVISRHLRLLFLLGFLTANTTASFLFHYTQVDQFARLENVRMFNQVDRLVPALRDSGAEDVYQLCRVMELKCYVGTGMEIPDAIEREFAPMIRQSLSTPAPNYRTMPYFDEDNDDPATASMYQLFVFNGGDRWLYLNDKQRITPYYLKARRNFAILYCAFSSVWLLILSYVMYRHQRFLDRKIRLNP